ncbi:hypothetical protein CK501_15605 [Halovibrio salipaludis]|uniref:Uncharacterized protein n=1 Tax=Halovibrio salipaludis TaxID=2032626 RepID=A0A2A2EWP9_9GAMM|nr:hypothetical protein [Halovibrio salipaludis]PAU76990.1 hypothetical protein CK501_15605 [Halovibrio salipaludis]
MNGIDAAAMRFPTTRLMLATLLVLCMAGELAFSHDPSAAAETFSLSVAEYAETTGNSGDDTPKTGKLPANPSGSSAGGLQQTGRPGTPQRVLQLQHHLTRFPILPQGPPLHA